MPWGRSHDQYFDVMTDVSTQRSLELTQPYILGSFLFSTFCCSIGRSSSPCKYTLNLEQRQTRRMMFPRSLAYQQLDEKASSLERHFGFKVNKKGCWDELK